MPELVELAGVWDGFSSAIARAREASEALPSHRAHARARTSRKSCPDYLLLRRWAIGDSYVAQLTIARPAPGKPAAAVVLWCPHEPEALSVEERTEYRSGCDAALSQAAMTLGCSVRAPRTPPLRKKAHDRFCD